MPIGTIVKRIETMNIALKKLITNWIPPGAINMARELIDLVRRAPYEYVPDGWRPEKIGKGWNKESVADQRKRQWSLIKNAYQGTAPLGFEFTQVSSQSVKDLHRHNLIVSFAYVLALSARCKERVSILDWGGDIGTYRLISEAVLKDVPIDYECAEVPLICRVGRELQPDVNFYAEKNEWLGKRYDLVLSSGAIHYVRDWKTLVRDLISVCSGYFYVTRLPIIHMSPSFVMIQRAYGTEYFGWVLNRQELIDYIGENGLVLVREFVNHEGPRIAGAPEQNIYMGFLFRKML
jgi:putative methyltransferase (TIGR04325 family)